MDAAAGGAGWFFRCLITPGIVALWPLLWRKGSALGRDRTFLGGVEAPVSPGKLRATHRLGWRALAILIPLGVAAALWWRPEIAGPSRLPVADSAAR